MSNPIEATPSVATRDGAITHTRVPHGLRLRFLPRVFGRHMMRGESLVYDWARRLCPDYTGGSWHFYDLSNGGFYLALSDAPGSVVAGQPDQMRICVDGNGFEESMSCDAAGIVITLFALNQMSWIGVDGMADAYHRLLDFAAEHAEHRLILSAID